MKTNPARLFGFLCSSVVGTELYDHAVDAVESRNLIGEPSYAGILHELEELATRTYRHVVRP
jgi:hypothetical protein